MTNINLSKEKNWLNDQVSDSELVPIFAMFWCIYEKKIWNTNHRSLDYNNLNLFGEKLDRKILNLENKLKNLEEEFEHFKNRYFNSKDSDKYLKNFLNSNKTSNIETFKIHFKKIKDNKEKDDIILKTSFLAIIIFRYRNNIFHGNKSPFDWKNYNKEIQSCIKIMYEFLKEV